MKLGTAQIIQGNALDLPLPDNSVDLVCTSPPYFGLRSYQDDGKHYEGQIGSEATPAEFLEALLAATREMVRVLKPSGSIFVNLGDKYAQDTERSRNGLGERNNMRHMRKAVIAEETVTLGKRNNGMPRKSLMGIPWRYAIACIDQLGLILRAEIIWNKPNGLPESVTDRVRRSHEQWFHFTKQPRYFAAVDEIREPHTRPDIQGKVQRGHDRRVGHGNNGFGFTEDFVREYNSLGKLPGSVWTVPTQPLTVPPELGIDHFAAYPMEWPRRIIQGWTPNGVCTACGQGRRPVTDMQYLSAGDSFADGTATAGRHRSGTRMGDGALATITGYACACGPGCRNCGTSPATCRDENVGVCCRNCSHTEPTAPTTPSVILDPFGGTGTTALVAKALGRTGISVDLSHDYCRMAVWRTNDPGELASALQVEKPEPVPDGQVALF